MLPFCKLKSTCGAVGQIGRAVEDFVDFYSKMDVDNIYVVFTAYLSSFCQEKLQKMATAN